MKDLGVLTRALRNVSRRKMRVLLVVIALGFSMAIMISIPSGIVANQAAAESLTGDYREIIENMEEEINKTVTLIECSISSRRGMFSVNPPSDMPFGMSPGFEQEGVFINETIVGEIRNIEGVKDIAEFFQTSSEEATSETMDTPRGSFTISRPLYTIIGVGLSASFIEEYSILPTDIIAGRALQEGDSGFLLMSSNLTDYYGVGVGDKVQIYGESFTIVGIYETASEDRTETRTVYMNISDAQTITGNAGNVSRLDVYAEDVSYVKGIAEVIEATYSDIYVTTYEERLSQVESMQEMYQSTLENAESTISQTQTIAFQEIVIAVAATSLIVLFMMLYTVRERTKEIGILKAIGFSNWNVMSQFMFEGILISLMAGVVGVILGIVATPMLSSLLLPHVSVFSTQSTQGGFPRQTMNPGAALSQSVTATANPQAILLAFGVAVLLGALGSLYPAWRASRTSPMEALRYE